MHEKYQNIVDVVKADIEKVNNNLVFDFDLKSELADKLKNLLIYPSKRIRSLMTILYLRASKIYLLPTHYQLLACVELVHNASLIHDDVIDKSNMRRNQKTINDLFDNHLAVLSGDYLIGIALEKLVEIGSLDVMQNFALLLQNMCRGEVNQYFDKFKKINLQEYIDKSTQKTASLFECALNSSLLLASTNYDEKQSEFAINFGLAFQIRDDLMNVLDKDNSKLSNDIQNGIYNAPYILSDELSDGIEKTKELLNNYVNCAKQCIDDLEDSVYKKALFELLELIENV